jgi:hypothetical protein
MKMGCQSRSLATAMLGTAARGCISFVQARGCRSSSRYLDPSPRCPVPPWSSSGRVFLYVLVVGPLLVVLTIDGSQLKLNSFTPSFFQTLDLVRKPSLFGRQEQGR